MAEQLAQNQRHGLTADATLRRTGPARGFGINGLFPHVSQALLLVMAALVVALLLHMRRRPCGLRAGPASVRASQGLLAASDGLRAQLLHAELLSPAELRGRLVAHGCRYKLAIGAAADEAPHIEVVSGLKMASGSAGAAAPVGGSGRAWSGLMWQLRRRYLAPIAALAATLLALLVGLYVRSALGRSARGLPVLGGHATAFPYKLAYSYIPYAVAAALEPLLVTVASTHCMLWPYGMLRRAADATGGYAALALDFDRSPPHFQLARALRARQLPLAALSAAILVANLLAISLAALFSPATYQARVPAELVAPAMYGNEATKNGYLEVSFGGEDLVRIVQNDALRTWITPERHMYVRPFFPRADDAAIAAGYTGPTLAFGSSVRCETHDIVYSNGTLTGLIVNGTNIDPFRPGGWSSKREYVFFPTRHGEGSAYAPPAADYAGRFTNTNAKLWGAPPALTAVWWEYPGDPHPANWSMPYLPARQGLAIKCNTSLAFFEVEATVDDAQIVRSVVKGRQLSASEYTLALNESFGLVPVTMGKSALVNRFFESALELLASAPAAYDGCIWCMCRINYLLTLLDSGVVRRGANVSHVPDASRTPAAMENLLQRYLATIFLVWAEAKDWPTQLTRGPMQPVQGAVFISQERVGMSRAMFYLSVAILGYFVVLFCALVWFAPRIPGHPPMSLAGTFACLYARTPQDPIVPGKLVQKKDCTGGAYRYGEFTGDDGELHRGVYWQPNGEKVGMDEDGGVEVEEEAKVPLIFGSQCVDDEAERRRSSESQSLQEMETLTSVGES
ncbi:hypothetical protein DFH27DRAFT_100073 [Peziza echinospora]|nr:hypothetical protein DFH27DRAFT_100073 [Peziza echinospora]